MVQDSIKNQREIGTDESHDKTQLRSLMDYKCYIPKKYLNYFFIFLYCNIDLALNLELSLKTLKKAL